VALYTLPKSASRDNTRSKPDKSDVKVWSLVDSVGVIFAETLTVMGIVTAKLGKSVLCGDRMGTRAGYCSMPGEI
jgi:hypothetical protein